MSKHTRIGYVIGFAFAVVGAVPAFGAFHLMQIEQVTGAVNGNKNAQAIQLRQRAGLQNVVSATRVRAWNAAGMSPVLIVDMTTDVANGAAGARILICSAGFAAHTSPAAVCDFTMTSLIPASYLAAGSITFEDDGGFIYWRLSWGGAAYTGTGAGSATNDADGNFNPPFGSALPTDCTRAVLFPGAAGALSTNNAANYILTTGAATFRDNAGTAYTINACVGAGDCNDSQTCTTDACMGSCCVFTPDNSLCPENGSFCDGEEVCNSVLGCVSAGNPCTTPPNTVCQEPNICGTCSVDGDCEDGVACTDDDCMAGTCVFTPNDANCPDDGMFCNGSESCHATNNCVSSGNPCAEELICNEGTDTCDTFAIPIALELVAGGSPTTAANLTLASPLGITDAGDGTGRLFIHDQAGLIRVIDAGGNLLKDPMLDVSALMPPLGIDFDPGPGEFIFDERGLLGLAFHPDFETNGKFYVRYSKPRTSTGTEPCDLDDPPGVCHEEVLAQYTMMGDPLTSNVADAGSEVIIFRWDKPQWNHNAGHIDFGPDGYLYISTGDGGGAHDGLCDSPPSHGNPPADGPGGNGQNRESKLGKMIRIDVDGSDGPGGLYGIPPLNPFVGMAGLDEIYAYGFRNPFRFSFDDGPGGFGSLYLADVGQDIYEEVDDVVIGGNYGWAIREGAHCFVPPCTPLVCPVPDLIDPSSEYTHGAGGLAIVGGYVYRGATYPLLQGKYVYGDFSADFGPTGRLYYFDLIGPEAFVRKEFFLAPSGAPFGQFLKGFGRDADGEICVAASDVLGPSGTTGVIYRIVPPPANTTVWDPATNPIPWPNNNPLATTRSLRFTLTGPAGPSKTEAIKVTMVDMQHPRPPNLPAQPPPNLTTYDTRMNAVCVGGTHAGHHCDTAADCPGAGSSCPSPVGCTADPVCVDPLKCTPPSNSCARWVGKLGTFYEAQGPPVSGPYQAARLQCTPYYWDWKPEGLITVVGADIAPSSEYSVQVYGASCMGAEDGCTIVSAPVTMYTRRSGDVEQPFTPPGVTSQPDVTDIAQLVNKFKNLSGALVKAISQLQPNLPELNADINALDIVAVVDSVKGLKWAFSGPCACPSLVTCGATACPSGAGVCVTTYGTGSTCVKTCTGPGPLMGDSCINNTHCVGSGTCGAGFCRDRCGRCSP